MRNSYPTILVLLYKMYDFMLISKAMAISLLFRASCPGSCPYSKTFFFLFRLQTYYVKIIITGQSILIQLFNQYIFLKSILGSIFPTSDIQYFMISFTKLNFRENMYE